MKITCETLTELNSTIKEIIDAYHDKNNKNIPSWCYFDYGCWYSRGETLRKYASDVRTCTINLFQQNPQLPEPPKPESEPLIELQQIRQWCIRAEAPTQPEQKQPASGGKPGGTGQEDIVELKPGWFGITVDIKELAKRFRKWVCSRRKD